MLQPNSVHSFRQRVAHFILKANLYLSWVLGIFPFTFDSRKRRLHISKWLLAYGVILHLCLVLLLYLPTSDNPNFMNGDLFEPNPLVRQLDFILRSISRTGISVTHLRTFWKCKELVEALNELLMLEHHHFRELILRDCPQLDWFVIFKGISPLVVTMYSLVICCGILDNNKTVHEGFCVSVGILAVLMVIMHFHLLMIYIYRLVWIINGQLLDMVTRLRRGESVDTELVKRLLFLYGRVSDLNTRLTRVYDIQNTFILFSLMPQAVVMNLCDLWLTIACCDLPERACEKTSRILKLFNDIEGMDKELERRISEFTLFCCHRRLKICQLGMFDINYEIGFRIFITNILYVLYLVQFDYMNLHFK
ncbi:putative gustatory receptor 22a [Drosophila ficusphila]|uniref:putative gustatory receptor 22a n=1 Tax=Drosophila ficusphila TaxID=30025 RepID=UPI001C8AB82C|nr:putative gustatory receptor 22a [Drosophila ficusphila]